MHLKSIKVFCDIVRQRSFSRAADENDISQSGASQLVHQLEQKLGVKLIDRSKRPFVMTPEGEVYYEGCRALVESYFSLEDKVRTLHQEVVGRVRVASIYSVGLHHMSRYMQEFLARYPKANVRLEYLHPHRVYQAIENDKADLGLVSYPRASRSVEAIGWRDEPMALVCAPTHRLARRQRLSLADLHGERMVGFDKDLTIRHEIDRALNAHRVEVEVVMEFDNIETIKRAIEIEAGVGLLPEPTVAREVAAGSLVAVPLETETMVRPLGIIYRRGKELQSTAWRFIELLQEQGKSAQDSSPAAAAAGAQGARAPAGESSRAAANGSSEVNGADGHGLAGSASGAGASVAGASASGGSHARGNGSRGGSSREAALRGERAAGRRSR